MFWLFLFFQGVDAGPAMPSCSGSPVTLTASPIDLGMPEPPYTIEWEGTGIPYIHLAAQPPETTTYTVFLFEGLNVYQDSTKVLVHPGDPDLNHDGFNNGDDWLAFYAGWGGPLDPEGDLDPDLDGQATILDWFFFAIFQHTPSTHHLA